MGRVNEAIWGASTSWPEAPYGFTNIGKVAYFGENASNLYSAVENNKLSISQKITDYSLGWCGMGAESNYANMKLFANSTDTFGEGERDVKQDTPVNFFFYCIPRNTSYTQQVCKMSNANATYIWDPPWNNLNANRYITPFTEFNINKIVWSVIVGASQTNTGNISEFTYNDYKTNQMSSYPYIRYIEAKPYIEESSSPISRISPFFPEGTGQTFKPAIFNSYSVYTTVPTDHFDDYAIFSEDRNYSLLLFGSKAQNVNDRYALALGNCKRKWTSPRSTYQDENLLEVLESALRTIACFGFFFVLDGEIHINDPLDSEYIYMGVIPSDYITHGEYTRGTANRNNNNWNWTNSNSSNYDPEADRDPNTYSNQTTFNALLGSASMLRRYVLSASDVEALSSTLWAIMGDLVQNNPGGYTDLSEYTLEGMLTANPIDCIVSLQKFPVNNIVHESSSEQIHFGKYSKSSCVGYPFKYTIIEYGFENIRIFPRFGNCFLDYAPYTTLELYVPFCGTVQLDPADFMNKTLSVRLEIDYTTGTCTAYICSDNLAIETINGVCAVDIPVTGIQTTTAMSQINNAIVQERTSQIGRAFTGTWQGIVTRGGGALSSALNPAKTLREGAETSWRAAGAEYELTHQIAPPHKIGAASSAASWCIDTFCRLLIHYPTGDAIKWASNLPELNDLSQFGKIHGFACCLQGIASDFSGYTQGGIRTEGLSATEQEKNMIESIFAGGVIL